MECSQLFFKHFYIIDIFIIHKTDQWSQYFSNSKYVLLFYETQNLRLDHTFSVTEFFLVLTAMYVCTYMLPGAYPTTDEFRYN
jgi:hypothetical protein